MKLLFVRGVFLFPLIFLSAVLVAQPCTRVDRWSLSPVASQVLYAIESNQGAIDHSPAPLEKILSTCNRFDSVRVDGPAIYSGARDLIALADREVDIAMFVWEPGSNAARMIGDGLIAAQVRRTPGDPLLVRMITDSVIESSVIEKMYWSVVDWMNRGLDPARVVIQLAVADRATPASAPLHDKFIVVDARYVLTTGANVEVVHDPGSPWHDSGYIFEGDVAHTSLAAFDRIWKGYDAQHWDCSLAGCSKRGSFHADYPRQWVPAFGSQRPGNVPVLAVGRTKDQPPYGSTNNPQDIAWQTLMAQAGSHVNIESPNINDDAFRNAVVDAVQRGVTVRLIAPMGFNDPTIDLPGAGGDNLEAVANLRQAVRSLPLGSQERLQLRWYSKDGLEPVTENGPYASHTKYLTTDDALAVVGSGNQDTPSWDFSHEYNLLVDDPASTMAMDNALFLPDWNRGITKYLEFYEGNNGTQDAVCVLGAHQDKSVRFSDPIDGYDYKCNNDEGRSVLLHDIPAGKVFRFYDDPNGAYQDDDWTEIVVKRAVSRKYVSSFEQSWEDADLRVISHRDNGLDGKLSRTEVASAAVGTVVDLYEGNSATQNLVCSNRISGTRTINLTNDAYCNNDEARSLVLYDFPADKAIFIHDDSGGSQGDDWAVIVPKRPIAYAVVPSFETSFENADMRVCVFYDNGLDGKVSRLRVGSASEAAAVCATGSVLSNGKPYTLSPQPHASYPDSGGELTNGVTDTGVSWVNAAGWLSTPPTITVDLGQAQTVTQARLFAGNSPTYGVYRPASVTVSTSTDGVNFSTAGTLTFSVWSHSGLKEQVDRGVLSMYATARWVRYTIAPAGPWVMVTELAVVGSGG
jgi:phosphatidylserine/phosphatidylglycerophosphate/cardiolipin synthase-like enzyme